MRTVLYYLLFVPLVAFAGPADLTTLVQRPDVWQLTPDTFTDDPISLHFSWTSSARESARCGPGLEIAGLNAVETIIRFDGQKLSRLTFSLYNRGDAGDLNAQDFGNRVQVALAKLTAACGSAPHPDDGDAASVVRTQGRLFTTANARWLLQWSFTREMKTRGIPFRAEFIRLEIAPPVAAAGLLQAAAERRAEATAKPQVHPPVTEATGDTWLNAIPMVDQGEKGYCVVATVERVLRYFGKDADQHELAQAANTGTMGGTSVDSMVDALKKLTARLKIRVRPQFDWDVNGFLRLITDYNRKAKREKLPEIQIGRIIDVALLYSAMQPELLKDVRLSAKADFTRFKSAIKRAIDEGVPLLWSLQLGVFPESNIPQNAGGHMRLIIGYNEKTGELIFSDSWGPGHEKKRYPMEEGWAATTALYTVEPF